MLIHFNQFVLSSFCLSCHGCCRYAQKKSCWSVKMTQKEKERIEKEQGRGDGKMQDPFALKEKGLLPDFVVDQDGLIATTPYEGTHICHFLNPSTNACGIYHARPFECQLYPFLLAEKEGQIFLAVHLSCPFVHDHRDKKEFEEYVDYLRLSFKKEAVQNLLKKDRGLIRDYQEFDNELEYLFEISF